jgi:amino-acid N-acetyltransferase
MPDLLSGLALSSCSQNDFGRVLQCIAELHLDDNDVHYSQFLVIKKREQLIGFGRIRTYLQCKELCSLGIMAPYRNRGLGTRITEELIKKGSGNLYVVTVIPAFFSRFGFEQTHEFPKEIESKISFCTGSLPVAERYVAMKFHPGSV